MRERAHERSTWRRLMTTPIGDWLRGRPAGSLDWPARLADADLPDDTKRIITRVVKKTRLWKAERVDVAEELIAHFEDGLETGTSTEELIRGFGDPDRAAKLIRRAKKRQRPLVWQAWIRSLQAVAAMIVLYLLLTGWFLIGEPDVSTNYYAKVTAPARAVPEGQRAWPIYRAASIEYGLPGMDLDGILFVKTPDGEDRSVRPTDEQWSEAKAFLQSHRDLLALIRKGAAKPGLGFTGAYSMRGFSELDRRALYTSERREELMSRAGPASEPDPDPDQATESHSVMNILLPHLPIMRQMSQLLAADLRLAAVQGDAERALANVSAIIGLARQARELPVVINDLVGRSILIKLFQRFAVVLAERPGIFRDSQLTALVHRLAALDDFAEVRWKAERYFWLDTFQRFYGPHGNITDEGLQFMPRVIHLTPSATANFLGPLAPPLSLPLANLLIADRDEMTEQYRRLWAMTEEYDDRPLWEQLRTKSELQKVLHRWRSSPYLSRRYWPLVALMPALDRASILASHTIAIRDALLVAIALELYRRDHGTYPDSLTALVPHYLPEPPVDHSTGEPLLYKVADGQPLLYGRGLDGDDDGGTQGSVPHWDGTGFSPVPEQGDWILYPLTVQ